MKAVISRDDLIRGITRTASALPQRSSIPALSNILLEFLQEDGALRSTATDLELAVIVDMPATIQESGALTVPGKKLLESVREMPDGEITLMSGERNTLTLKCGKARLTLRGTAREEYPSLPPVSVENPFHVASGVLRDAVRKTIIAAGTDDTRTFLTGVNMVISGSETRLVATDGHRLAICDFSLSEGPHGGKALNVNVLAPARVLSLAALDLPDDGKVQIAVTETHIVFITSGGNYYSRLIAEKFPDYEKIIPKSAELKVTLNTAAFAEALRRVNPFANPRTQAVNLMIKSDRVVVATEAPEFGEAHDEVDAKVTGGAMEISFRARYIADVLKVLKGAELTIDLGAQKLPAIFTTADDKGYRYILMPMRG